MFFNLSLRLKQFILIISVLGSLNIACADYLTTSGERVNFEDLKAQKKWVIVHYWANWCGVCIEELPVYNELASLKKPNLKIFGVHLDAGSTLDRTKFKLLKSKYRLKFPHFIQDPSEFLGIKQLEFVPTTVFIDPMGKIERVKTGPLTKKEILKIINRK